MLARDARRARGCVTVGDYAEVDGPKEQGQLFYADDLSITKR